VALHTEAERSAMFVREADAAYDLGPASLRPYLDLGVLERALVETRADAAWVGWGFVAEDPAFAELCERVGVTFIGPSPDAMRKLGDKIGAKLIAEEVGVPVAPWSRGPEGHPDPLAQLGEGRVLGDEAPAHPGGVGAGVDQRPLQRLQVQIWPGGGGAQVVRDVGLTHEHRASVDVGVEGHRLDPGAGLGGQVTDGVDEPHGGLATVDDRDSLEHQTLPCLTVG